jgi:hypothetical protein
VPLVADVLSQSRSWPPNQLQGNQHFEILRWVPQEPQNRDGYRRNHKTF